MSKKNWIYLGLVILTVVVLPGGFLLAGYLTKKKLETPATPVTNVTTEVDPSTIPDSDGSNDTSSTTVDETWS